ncbi:MAG: response regulator [Proteobacteria bacterium]|nr:response regulator [Pseudomonadota bacterium]
MLARRHVIALVEDDPLVRVSTAKTIQHAGHDVVSAATGYEGLQLVRDHKPDLLLIDLMLPRGMDGITLAREARTIDTALRFVFMSGKATPAEQSAAREFGPLLAKPFTETDLLAAIAHARK